jgi:hypothetical protein
LTERWILAKLRNRPFFSLHQLNEAILELLEELNNKAFQKLAGSRQSVFESLERPALMPLPVTPYQFAQWKIARVNIDYHIDVQRHYYSVPYQLIHKQVDVRYTDNTVECFYKSNRVASHIRSHVLGHHTTVKEHMPESHRKWLEWTPQRFINWAAKIGPDTRALIEQGSWQPGLSAAGLQKLPWHLEAFQRLRQRQVGGRKQKGTCHWGFQLPKR